MTEDQQMRCLPWDACYNVRELGGYPTHDGGQTRWQTLVRADNLHRLTPQGQVALREYGVRTIIDLRLAHELERHPNPFAVPQGSDDYPRYLNLPLLNLETDAAVEAAQPTQGEYIVIVERSKGHVAEVINAVAAGLERGGVLVHCHGGKDRTGIVVALLLSLVGVPDEIIAEDYALSEAMLEGPHLAWLEEQGRALEKPIWMYAPPQKMQGLLDYLDREYGGPEEYLMTTGVTQSNIALIRKYLVVSDSA